MQDQARNTQGRVVEFASRNSPSYRVPPLAERHELKALAADLSSSLTQSLLETRDEFQNQRRIADDATKRIAALVGRFGATATVDTLESLIGTEDAARLSELRRRRAPTSDAAPGSRLGLGIPEIRAKAAEVVRDLEEIAVLDARLAAAVRASPDPAVAFARLGSGSPDWDAEKLERLSGAMSKAVAFHAGCLFLVKQHAVVEALLHDFATGRSPLSFEECRTIMESVCATDDPEALEAIRRGVVLKESFDRFETSVLVERCISPEFGA